MQSTKLFATIALFVAAISAPTMAENREHPVERQHATQKSADQLRAAEGFDYRMQTVLNEADANAPAYGWRYFTDPATPRAVVISPQGDYYYSRGKGLRWIAAEQYERRD